MRKNTLSVYSLHKKIVVIGIAAVFTTLQSCGGDGSPKLKDSEQKTILEASKGVITEVEEIAPGNDYKIIDERIIDEKEKSVAIVHKLDGKIDTLSLQKLKSEGNSTGRSALTGVLAYSLASSYFNRNLANTTPNSSYYKNPEAFSKSTGLKNDLTKSATSRRVSVPGKGSTGYGSGKSFRSHGG